MKSYKDLEIYKRSYDLALKVHELTIELPKHEMYEEGSQVRRSSKGITSCITEGYGRKRYKAEFIKFLVYAHASCDETICHLGFIRDLYNPDNVTDLMAEYEKLGAQINRFLKYVDKDWNAPQE